MSQQPVRRNRRKQRRLNGKLIVIAVAVVAVLVGAVCLLWPRGEDSSVAYDPNRGPLKELTVGEENRRGETMVVDTSYLPVEFPYAFSDLIRIHPINQDHQTALSFCALIAGEEQELFTIWFNGKDGQMVGTFDLKDGKKPVPVTLVFYSPDASLQGDDRVTFFATQETVNDVLNAMKLQDGFTYFE